MQEIPSLQNIDLEEAAIRFEKYKANIKERINEKHIPHNKKFKQGFFIPKHPLKCMNVMETPEPKPIIWRSSWEGDFCKFCDETKTVVRWGSEILQILYKDPIRNKMAFYFPDFFVQYIDNKQQLKSVLIEIKPLKEAVLSEAKTKRDKINVARNAMKWKAAIQFCKKRGFEFKVIHDKTFKF